MAARVTQHAVEVIIARITYSPTTVTGAGVTQHAVEAITGNPGSARVTQHAVEVVVGFNPDGSHGDTGGGGGTTPTTHTYGYAL